VRIFSSSGFRAVTRSRTRTPQFSAKDGRPPAAGSVSLTDAAHHLPSGSKTAYPALAPAPALAHGAARLVPPSRSVLAGNSVIAGGLVRRSVWHLTLKGRHFASDSDAAPFGGQKQQRAKRQQSAATVPPGQGPAAAALDVQQALAGHGHHRNVHASGCSAASGRYGHSPCAKISWVAGTSDTATRVRTNRLYRLLCALGPVARKILL